MFSIFLFFWIVRNRLNTLNWNSAATICRIDHNYFKNPISMPMPFHQIRSKVDFSWEREKDFSKKSVKWSANAWGAPASEIRYWILLSNDSPRRTGIGSQPSNLIRYVLFLQTKRLSKLFYFPNSDKKLTENNVNASGDTSMIGPCFAFRSISHTLYFGTVLILRWIQHRSEQTFRLIKLNDVCLHPLVSCLSTIQTILWTRQLIEDNIILLIKFGPVDDFA